jgi:uncharacterized protein (TIGR02246 family)
MIGLLSVVVALLWAPGALAQTGEEAAVMDTFNRWIDARNAADADAIAGFWTAPAGYFADGSLLFEFDMSRDEVRELVAAQFEAGREDVLTVHHLQATILGDTALVTCYLSGTAKPDPETTMEGPFSMTSLWVKDRGTWKIRHFHQSLVAGGPVDVLDGVVKH